MTTRLLLPARLVLDASAFDVPDKGRGGKLRALVERTFKNSGEVCSAAVTLAEVCRGTARTRQVEAALHRDRGGKQLKVVPTDLRMAKRVGAILHDTGSGSERLGDAHVVATCVETEPGIDADNAVVVTSDPDDIIALAQAVKGMRIVIRDPVAPDARL